MLSPLGVLCFPCEGKRVALLGGVGGGGQSSNFQLPECAMSVPWRSLVMVFLSAEVRGNFFPLFSYCSIGSHKLASTSGECTMLSLRLPSQQMVECSQL